jgi:hypothetical protein
VALVAYETVLTTRKHLIAYTTLTLTLVSWLSLIALGLVSSLLWLYEGVLGVEEGLIITSRGFSPLTALVFRSDIESRLSSISNITVEYYLVTPVLVNGEFFVLRSTSVNLTDSCVLIGADLARELGVVTGNHVVVSSVFTGEVYYLEVCGYTGGYVLEASYDLVARIRGVTKGYYSYVVVKGNSEAQSRVLEALGVKPSEVKLAGLIVAVLSRISDNKTRVVLYRALTEAYITGFGLQRDYILYFAVTVAVASLIGLIILGLDAAKRTSSTLRVLRVIGVSKRRILLATLLVGFTVSTIAYVFSLALYTRVEVFTLSVLGYVFKTGRLNELFLLVYLGLLVLFNLGLALGVHCEVE